jgi:predicted RNA methylase
MTLTEDVKQNIINEFEQWKERTYGNLTDKQRKELGAFHTPPLLTIKMIEKFNDLEGTIMDPTAGSGNLIAGCILAGADPKLCYANELDLSIYNVLVQRLTSMGVPKENITMMDALSPEFSKHCIKVSGETFRFGGMSENSL